MRMNMILKTSACLAWLGLGVASSASANAFAITTQIGDYATCSASYAGYSKAWCYDMEFHTYELYTSYTQQIKLVSTACSSGPCSSDNATVYTDAVYPVGRKTASSQGPACVSGGGATNYYYNLGSCAC
jgi:hypothetical protein